MRDQRAEAERWWRQALSDFDFLGRALEVGKYDTCCFLAQHTAEKALKAFLFHQGEELILTYLNKRREEVAHEGRQASF